MTDEEISALASIEQRIKYLEERVKRQGDLLEEITVLMEKLAEINV
jgi:uncharacterized coiled-coil protein SlyX